jgi:ADP-ribose pyrophosphatase
MVTNELNQPLADAQLIETKVDGAQVFNGNFLNIQRDFVNLPDGARASREYVLHPGASMVVPIFSDGTVLVERQYRHPSRKIYTEFPAGKIDSGEDPVVTAIRELREETGYQCQEIAHITSINNAIAYSDEHIELYFARGLTEVGKKLDQGEFINCMVVTPAWLMNEMLEGRLNDVKTQVGLWWLMACQRGDVPWPNFKLAQE